jgi:hypothetical protein
MPDTLAQMIRAKYPGAYDGVDDATLEKAVLAKYPQYQSLVKPQEQAEAKPEGKSISGFLSNALTSTGRLLKDTATGAVDLAKFAATEGGLAGKDAQTLQRVRTGEAVGNAPQIAKAVGGSLKGRYIDNLGDTLYTDPAGVAADVSTLLGIGGAPRLAGRLNPLRAAAAPVGGTLKGAANLTVRGTLRPSKAIREDFGGSKGVADAVLKERVFSEGSAQKKLSASVKEADDLLAAKEAAGVRGVPAKNVADSLTGSPSEAAGRRQKLGKLDAPKAITDRRQAILDANAIPGQPNATRHIPLTEAQALKREAQDMAYEARRGNLSMDAQADSAVARALKEGIEQRVPEVGPINERSQRLIGAQRAFEDAADRPRALTNYLAILGGATGFAGGGTPGGVLGSALVKAIDSPRLGALTGIAMNEAGDVITHPGLLQAALLARLAQQEPE